MVSPLLIFQVFLPLSLMALGGGNTIIAEMQRMVVEVHHWVTSEQFSAMYALSQAVPGPSMMIVTLLGLAAGGFPGAGAATVATFGPQFPAGLRAGPDLGEGQGGFLARGGGEGPGPPLPWGLVFAGGWALGRDILDTPWEYGVLTGSAPSPGLAQDQSPSSDGGRGSADRWGLRVSCTGRGTRGPRREERPVRMVQVFWVDAFTRERFSGNPAGVVLGGDGLEEGQMRRIARELNCSETRLRPVAPGGGPPGLGPLLHPPRWRFRCAGTPPWRPHYVRAREGRLEETRLVQLTGAGLLPVGILPDGEDYRIRMTQGEIRFEEPLPEEKAEAGLGSPGAEPGGPGPRRSGGRWCPRDTTKVMVPILRRSVPGRPGPGHGASGPAQRGSGVQRVLRLHPGPARGGGP